MSVDVVSEIIIRRPRDEVVAYSGNPENAPAWYVKIKEVEWKSASDVSVGSRIAFVADFLGRRLAYTYEIMHFQPSRRMLMSTKEYRFLMETTYTWEDAANGATLMTLRNRGAPSGFSGLIAPVPAASMRRANRKDLARLKEILEAGS